MDINEIICNSVKTIVDARINELNFDKITCFSDLSIRAKLYYQKLLPSPS